MAYALMGFAILIAVASIVTVLGAAYLGGGSLGRPQVVPQPPAKGTVDASIVSGR